MWKSILKMALKWLKIYDEVVESSCDCDICKHLHNLLGVAKVDVNKLKD